MFTTATWLKTLISQLPIHIKWIWKEFSSVQRWWFNLSTIFIAVFSESNYFENSNKWPQLPLRTKRTEKTISSWNWVVWERNRISVYRTNWLFGISEETPVWWVERYLDSYQSFKNQTEELIKRKIELERLLHQNQGQLSTSAKSVQNTLLKIIDEELKTIVMPAKPKLVRRWLKTLKF